MESDSQSDRLSRQASVLSARRRKARDPVPVGAWMWTPAVRASRRPHADARLRGDARGRDGGVREKWIAAAGAKTAYIERGSPWENGYIESFNARLRDELLNGEIFYTLREAQIVIESWRRHYNTIRPHASLGYKPPAPEVFMPAFAAWPAALRRPAPPATLAQPPTLN